MVRPEKHRHCYQVLNASGHNLVEGLAEGHADQGQGFGGVGLGRRPDPTIDVPAIAVEFVSAARRDRRRDYEEKRHEYQEAGVVEHWIVDRFLRILTVYRNSPQGSVEVVVSEQETYQTPLLPGFELPLARLLAVADRWV